MRTGSELILGGQRSGKSRRAELLAREWCDAHAGHGACFIATAQAGDAEMQERIHRHRRDRAQRLPQMPTLEEPRDIAGAIAAQSRPSVLLVVDCLTLWLANWMMPLNGAPQAPPVDDLVNAVRAAPGPLVLVSNEIGLGVVSMSRDVREFVDELGRVNQRLAQACERVTLMVAGLPVAVKNTEQAPAWNRS